MIQNGEKTGVQQRLPHYVKGYFLRQGKLRNLIQSRSGQGFIHDSALPSHLAVRTKDAGEVALVSKLQVYPLKLLWKIRR
jgi:hypothetical protein